MCGRYTNDAELSDIRLAFDVSTLELFRDWKPTYNVTPGYGPGFEQLFVVGTREGKRALRLGRFWLLPPGFAGPRKGMPTTFNARSEELAQKPLWKGAFAERRCLVPATGWREFRPEGGKKQPYHFHFGRRLFAFAGLYSTAVTPEGEAIDSFAIITTEPTPLAAKFHDRMPLVVAPELYGRWLGADDAADLVLDQARSLAAGMPLEVYASDPIANNGRYEGPRAIDVAPRPSLAVASPRTPVQGELFGSSERKARGG